MKTLSLTGTPADLTTTILYCYARQLDHLEIKHVELAKEHFKIITETLSKAEALQTLKLLFITKAKRNRGKR